MNTSNEYNAATVMVDANVDGEYGDKPAFVDPNSTLTYSGLQRATCQVANMLTGMGIQREVRITLLMHDTVAYPAVFWGAIRAGIVPVCLNTLLTQDQYRYMLNDNRAQVLIVSADLLDVVKPILKEFPALQHVIVDGGDASEFPQLSDLMADESDSFKTAPTHPDDTAFWLYSSGSTGAPKGVCHVHTSFQYIADTYGKNVLGIKHDDVVFSAAKMFFAYGLGASMALPMSVGATTVLLPDRPTPQAVLATMKANNPTLFFGVPTLYAALLADPDCKPENSSNRLRLCISAGEALPEDVGNKWEERMKAPVLDGIGSTEMLHVFLSNRPGDIRYGTSGREFEGYKLKLLDEDGQLVPDGELGELLVSGGSAGDGYWNQRAKSRAIFAGEWVHTGDKYIRDKDGYYYYCGRTDDMFKVSGRWVSPFEVEQALVSSDKVLEAAVVAHHEGDGLIKPKAFIVLMQGVQPSEDLFQELKDLVKETVGVWKYPRWIEVRDELPKTATGKIQRFLLRNCPAEKAMGQGGLNA